MTSKLPPGLYEQVISRDLEASLQSVEDGLKQVESLDPKIARESLARTVHTHVARALGGISGDDSLEQQVALVNSLLAVLEATSDGSTDLAKDAYSEAPQQLLAILEPTTGVVQPTPPRRPHIPLSTSDLLVNARNDLSIGPELQIEIESADRVDLLCSFVKWSGLRLFEKPLSRLLAKRPGCVRVLTTTYMGATESRALDCLKEMGAQVKVSYDHDQTRLHAKAWLFHRRSGFSTAYVGSSNMSSAAMLDGLEWNVRVSQIDNSPILRKFSTAFEQYWEDGTFELYDPQRFNQVLKRVTQKKNKDWIFFELRARPHQQQVLNELKSERDRGYHKNLVVAATGTGKTVIAALDYKRLRKGMERANLLFVAHRIEILKQSRRTFQVALSDGGFGELLAAGKRLEDGTHVFANVQSLTGPRLDDIPADFFDVVIIDEFHHSAAKSYDKLLTRLEPKYLLGLTATPDRADGKDVLHWFDSRIASETRLWQAMDQGLLCPFQYFGVGGGPSLANLKWSGGRYNPTDLSNLLTGDDMYAMRILQEVRSKVRDIHDMRALGFCVDLAHARFMTDKFKEAGIDAIMLSGKSKDDDRSDARRRLVSGEVQAVFTVDLFNEGVGLPGVDFFNDTATTESATIFLQQLGRGLRRSEGKECCTVLDFIGDAHRRFRFDARYRAIVGGTRREVERLVEDGFPTLPSGCVIQLDRQAQAAVLANIRAAIGQRRRGLVDDLRSLAVEGHMPTLSEFLARTETDLEDLYAKDKGWADLLRLANLQATEESENARIVQRALCRLLHVNDDRLHHFGAFLSQTSAPAGNDQDPCQRLLFVLLGFSGRAYDQLGETWTWLWQCNELRSELIQLFALLHDRRRNILYPLGGALDDLPLQVHGSYTRFEVIAALDERTKGNKAKRTQTGVYNVKARKIELLFVELEKDERHYSKSTLYEDQPVTPTHFHWESQNSCHEGTPSGGRYLKATRGGEQTVLLFVRQRKRDARGVMLPYLFLGRCFLMGHRGARPMKIDWELETPMPPWFFAETKVAGG
jgi:superfamily II DNA or RNA helicase